ncbi:hypothetical protein bcgnr5414_65330 [Bacillus cereus]
MLKTKPVGIEKPVDEIGHVSKAEETLSFQERLKVGDFSQRPALNFLYNEPFHVRMFNLKLSFILSHSKSHPIFYFS